MAQIIATILLIPWGGIIIMSPMMFATPGYSNDLKSIVTSLIFLFYPIAIFMALKLMGARFYKMDPVWWALGVLIFSGAISLAVGIPKKIINITRGISNEGFFKNEKHAYYDGQILSGAEQASFVILSEDKLYAKDAQHVYYMGQLIPNADAKTFTSIGKEAGYFWKDHKSVYIYGKEIVNSDSASFIELKNHYWKDQFHVYNGQRILTGADPKTYVLFEESEYYSKDAKNVYYYSEIILGADAPTFVPVGETQGLLWKDSKHVYHEGTIVPDSHGPSYEALKGLFWKDKSHVFYENKIIDGALPETFTCLNDEIGKDSLGVYIKNKKATNIQDLASFNIIKINDEYFAQDKFNFYVIFYNSDNPIQPLKNVDINTFTTLDFGYAKDKNNVYSYRNKNSMAITLEGVSPNSFTVGYDASTESDARAGDLLFDQGQLIKK